MIRTLHLNILPSQPKCCGFDHSRTQTLNERPPREIIRSERKNHHILAWNTVCFCYLFLYDNSICLIKWFAFRGRPIAVYVWCAYGSVGRSALVARHLYVHQSVFFLQKLLQGEPVALVERGASFID